MKRYSPATIACSEYWSGKWSRPDRLTVHIYQSAEPWVQDISTGVLSWNGISNKVAIISIQGGTDTGVSNEIRIKAEDCGTIQYTAYCTNYVTILGVPVPSNIGTWAYSVVILNVKEGFASGYDRIGPTFKKKVAAHELGHSFGLDHVLDSCPDALKALMFKYYDAAVGWYAPQLHDKNVLKAKYGN